METARKALNRLVGDLEALERAIHIFDPEA